MIRRLRIFLILSVLVLLSSRLLAGPPESKKERPEKSPLPDSLLSVTNAEPPQNRFWKEWNPHALKNRWHEHWAVSNAVKIYKAALIYTERKRTSPKRLEHLIDEQLLSEDFRGGVKGKYRFSLNVSEVFFGVQADPLDRKQGLHYFYVGLDGIVRSETDKPATEKSAPAL